MKHYPLAHPYISKKEERYVMQTLRSGKLSIGPFIEKFEKKFAQYLGVKHAIAVSSGTAGLHLALIAAGVGEGDEVITSPFSFVASANAILYVGAKPVFIDIDSKTYNIDPSKIEARITKKTKAILPIHIFGQPAEMDAVMRIAKKHKLAVIEDACESLGSTFKNKNSGTFGEAGVFAFYANKQLTTGEGGMIVTNDDRMDEMCRSLRNQGRGPDMQWLDHVRLGYNYRLDEMSSALGLAQIENIRFLMKKRLELAKWYREAFAACDLIELPYTAPGSTNTYFVYVVRIRNKAISRDGVIEALGKRGIASKQYLPSIHLFDFYRKQFGYKRGDYPVSEGVSDSTLALPFYIGLTKKDTTHIAKTLEEILRAYEKK
jgi:perosamine synthetase